MLQINAIFILQLILLFTLRNGLKNRLTEQFLQAQFLWVGHPEITDGDPFFLCYSQESRDTVPALCPGVPGSLPVRRIRVSLPGQVEEYYIKQL
jgi:hypothetical protein